MSEELELFYEDSSQQLQFMETALLDASDGTDDKELISEVFRAMHTIKGTAGMFDFDMLVSFTHVAENVLDNIRQGQMQLDASLAAVFMQVKDITETMIEDFAGGREPAQHILQSKEQLQKTLEEFLEGKKPQAPPDKAEQTQQTMWSVAIQFSPDFFYSGMGIISIIKFFKTLGTLQSVQTDLGSMPSLELMNPLQTYASFSIQFLADCGKEDIEEIFEFVEDDVELHIANVSKQPESQTQQSTQPPAAQKNEQPAKKEENKGRQKSSSLRVDSQKIDTLINKMSEMVIKNAQIAGFAASSEDESLEEMSYEMSALLEEVRDSAMNIRMVQVKDSFIKYRRIVNDTAQKLGKQIEFILEGEETELDKSVVEKLTDPLTHMIRNSIDHGIEDPQTREQKGKEPKGRVWLRAYPDAGTIIIELEDDGKGINKNAVEQKAIANGVIDQNHSLSDREIYKLIFAAGLSTADAVSNISGRGVGMDVVRKNIEELRGTIEVDSKQESGTKITIRLPLTLAIIDGFLVQAGHSKYIIPLDMIVECIEFNSEVRSGIDDENTINVRGEILPLLNIRKFFNDPVSKKQLQNTQEDIRENIVIVKFGATQVGLLVDELFGEQQTVIKSLGAVFEKVPGISGGCILGSGEVALIFDIARLIQYRIEQGRL